MTQDYAGDITSREAWDMLQQDPDAVLVDVRNDAEWRYVGVPDLTSLDKKTVFVCWQTYPEMRHNSDFVADVAAAGVRPPHKVLLLCRSGVRSRNAAIALGRYLLSHAQRVLEQMRTDPIEAKAEKVWRFVWRWVAKHQGQLEIPRREIFIGVKGGIVQRSRDLDEPLALLVESGYLRGPLSSATPSHGPAQKRYAINPAAIAAQKQLEGSEGTK